MKKIFALLSLSTALMLISTGCNNSISNAGPKEVLTAFFSKLAKKDIDGAAQLATKESKGMLDMMKMGMAMAEERKDEMANKDFTKNLADVKIGDANINGDMATVPVSVKGEDNFDFPLKKEDGSWKVDFTITSMMKIGMQHGRQSMENDGMNPDSVLQHMDPEKMKRGMEMADSMMKHMDPEKMKEFQRMKEKMKEQM